MSLARNAAASQSSNYERHQPEQTLLYQLVEQHYPALKASLEAQGQNLSRYIQQEFDDFLQCGRLKYGFLRVRCEDCHHERLVAFSCKRRGFCPSCGARWMAESAALLVDEVFPDGVYAEDAYGKQRFHRVKAPTYSELNTLVHTLSYRIARCLEKQY